MLWKRPASTLLAIVMLGGGIGLTTTMFSVVNGAFLRGLPFEEGQRILYVGRARLDAPDRLSPVTMHDFADWRATQQSFEALSGVQGFSADLSADGVAPARYEAARLTPDAFHTLRVQPEIGRLFSSGDAQPNGPRVALISDRVWTAPFGRDPHIIGRMVRINGEPAEIIGVMPAGFGFPGTNTVWMPLTITLPAVRGDGETLNVFGRLKPGVTESSANNDLRAIAARLAAEHVENRNLTALARPYVSVLIGRELVTTLTTMLAAVFGVLLIACVNVTNLQLARTADRVKEVGIRMALGASRAVLVRQLLIEGMLLSAMGAVLGVGIAAAGTRVLTAKLAETNPPFWVRIDVDTPVLLFALGLSVIAAVASSLMPALRATRRDLYDVMKDAGRGTTGLSAARFSTALVVAELTLSFCLLAVSGLMIRSVVEFGRVQYPFRTDVLYARVEWPEREFGDMNSVRVAASQLQSRLAAVPGITHVALATGIPDRAATSRVTVEGAPPPASDADQFPARRVAASPEFFGTMQIPLRQGRLFDSRDREGELPVAVVSEDFAARFFPNGGAIGQRVRLSIAKGDEDPWWTIIGIVPRVTASDRAITGTTETILLPLAQAPARSVTIFAAGPGDPLALLPEVRRGVADAVHDMPIFDVDSVAGRFRAQVWPIRVFGSLFTSFGLSALLMASAGLYGVMAVGVRRRTPEIGLRMALGANRGDVIRMVLRQGLAMVLVGIVAGIGLGGKLGGFMQALLFRVEPWDSLVFGLTIGVLSAAGLLATVIPAVRAASIDPQIALRND